ncbi:MAG: hypothetical protein ACKOCX_02120, partial [Planctomycetota bacterium]
MSRRLAATITIVAATLVACAWAGAAAALDPDAAPADAWPMARGCPAGTGRSAAVLQLPLVEAWRRDFEQTAFTAVPVIAD